MESKHLNKSHNISYLLYHFVCPIKNRRKVLKDPFRENLLKEICWEIELNYEIYFLEIWSDIDHVHFLIQSVPIFSVSKIIRIIKSLIWREMFSRDKSLKKELLWGSFWTSWYYVNTVWRYTSESTIREYVKNQWVDRDYKQVLKSQLKMF